MAHQIRWPASEAVRARSLNRFEAIDPARTALVVVDLQVGFVTEGFPAFCRHAADTLPNANRLARALREAGGLVVFTRHTTLDDPVRGPPAWQRADPGLAAYFASLEPGAAGHGLHPDLDVRPGDLVVDKARFSAFLPISSSLDADLRGRGIDTVIITGTLTNVCCESSARDAHMLNYKVFFVSDATATSTDEEQDAALNILGLIFADVRRTEEMLALVQAAAPTTPSPEKA